MTNRIGPTVGRRWLLPLLLLCALAPHALALQVVPQTTGTTVIKLRKGAQPWAQSTATYRQVPVELEGLPGLQMVYTKTITDVSLDEAARMYVAFLPQGYFRVPKGLVLFRQGGVDLGDGPRDVYYVDLPAGRSRLDYRPSEWAVLAFQAPGSMETRHATVTLASTNSSGIFTSSQGVSVGATLHNPSAHRLDGVLRWSLKGTTQSWQTPVTVSPGNSKFFELPLSGVRGGVQVVTTRLTVNGAVIDERWFPVGVYTAALPEQAAGSVVLGGYTKHRHDAALPGRPADRLGQGPVPRGELHDPAVGERLRCGLGRSAAWRGLSVGDAPMRRLGAAMLALLICGAPLHASEQRDRRQRLLAALGKQAAAARQALSEVSSDRYARSSRPTSS